MNNEQTQTNAAGGQFVLTDGLAGRYFDEDLFSLDDEKYAAAVYRRIDAEVAEEHNLRMTEDLIRRDNEKRNALARLDMIFDETNYRFRCADREAAALMARLMANG